MELEQRLIVCCNYRAHSNEEKGQAIALYEKDIDTSRFNRINADKYFSEPDDCEVHIVPNPSNENNYAYLQSRFEDKLYLIQCVENRNVEDGSNFSKNKSNLFKVETVEPRSICEVVFSELPDETNPEIILEAAPLTRHIFIQDKDYTYGPFEYAAYNNEDNQSTIIKLKKPNDIKYLGGKLPKLSTLRYSNDKISSHLDEFHYPDKIINNKSFKHSFLRNVQDLRDIECEQINYAFMDELSKAIATIVKETNTKGITQSQITMLSTRIKNKRNSFNFDTDYIFKQLKESSKFEKVILESKAELRELVLEQALNENEKIKNHFLNLLKSDENIINEVQDKIRSEQHAELSKLEQLDSEIYNKNAELVKLSAEIQNTKVKKAEIDKDKENRAYEELKQKETELNKSIDSLETKKAELEDKYEEVFKYDSLKSKLEKLEEEIKFKRRLYDEKAAEVVNKEQEIKAQKVEFDELTQKSADHYKKELLSVKNSIDVLTQIDNDFEIASFESFGSESLCTINTDAHLHEYIKYVQLALSEQNRNMSIEHVINYLICIDTSFITILSGLPGTGKTSLVNILGDHVMKSRFNNIQVGRGWSSERDLLGYFNPITNSYISSGSGMFEFLDGMETDERLNLVLLDEANLSPIEHYWSKFMGLTDSFEERELNITNHKSIKLSGNLRFLATINNDMTTEPLSPRLIDRAPCIRLDVYNLKDEGSKSGLDTVDDEEIEMLKNKFASNGLHYANFQQAIRKCKCDQDSLEPMLEVIEEIIRLLSVEGTDEQKFGARVHISERRNQVVKLHLKYSLGLYEDFRSNAVSWVDVNKHSYFLDFSISQFILPLITGHGKNFKNRIVHLKELLKNTEKTHSYELPISIELVTRLINQGEEDLDTYDFMSLR